MACEVLNIHVTRRVFMEQSSAEDRFQRIFTVVDQTLDDTAIRVSARTLRNQTIAEGHVDL